VHDSHAVRFVTGREVIEVFAVGADHGEAFIAEAGDVDSASALLTLDGGSFAHVAGTRYNAAGHDVRLEVLGSLGSVVAGLSDGLPVPCTDPGVTATAGPDHTGSMDRFADAYRAELTQFVAVVAGTATPRCTVLDALEAFYVAEACEQSRREHRPVWIEEVRR
jgi:myo-inositol 2-dehydrogenase/D-chiro-inositol 1-dehydrogenase